MPLVELVRFTESPVGTEYRCIQGLLEFSMGPTINIDHGLKSWNTNAVALPLNEDCWLAINGAPAAYSGPTYQQAIKDFVSLINQNGM